VLTRNDRDLQILDAQFRPKVVAEDIVGYETWLQSEPDSVALHDDVAMLYLEVNRPNDAVRHFSKSVALKPRSAPAHFNLGTALTVAGREDDAIAEYRTALELNPEYALAHNNLGSILLRQGHNADAVAHLTRALALDPTNAQAHYNVGIALRQRGENADAIRHLQQALKGGESPAVLGELALVLITAPEESVRNPAQAVRYAERAAELTGRANAAFLDLLAAAYASAGNFTGAVEAGEAALRLSPPDAAAVRARVERYRRGLK
jgi:Flp pilus assembly protein TadD